MQQIQFQRPANFSATLNVCLERPPERWPCYLFIPFSIFGFFGALLVGDYVAAIGAGLLIGLFGYILRWINDRIDQPLLMEVSADGVYFYHWRLFIPFERIKSISENVETGLNPLLGSTKLKSLSICFEIPSAEFNHLRKTLVKGLSWPRKIREGQITALVSVNVPFTVGKGQPLNYSKEDLLDKLNLFLARS